MGFCNIGTYSQKGSIKCTQGWAGSQPSLQMQIWVTSTNFLLKYPMCFIRKPSFACFFVFILDFTLWMWAGDFDFGIRSPDFLDFEILPFGSQMLVDSGHF